MQMKNQGSLKENFGFNNLKLFADYSNKLVYSTQKPSTEVHLTKLLKIDEVCFTLSKALILLNLCAGCPALNTFDLSVDNSGKGRILSYLPDFSR